MATVAAQPPASAAATHSHSHNHAHSNAHSHTHSIQLLHNAAASGMPHGLGLLTTVASLPPKYRSRYLNIKTKCEIPLDLSVKPPSPLPLLLPVETDTESSPTPTPPPQIANDVPMATAFAEVYTEPAAAAHAHPPTPAGSLSPLPPSLPQVIGMTEEKHITPPQSPAKRKFNELEPAQSDAEASDDPEIAQPAKMVKTHTVPAAAAVTATATVAAAAAAAGQRLDETPAKPIKASDTAPRTAKSAASSAKPTRNKATRKLKFDEETSSPVSGTIIRPLEDITDGSMQYSNGDIDPKYNIVEITEETKAELAAIKNVIGDYVCKLCRIKFDDAFGLARHRCACIVLLEYRCPECGKQFNCPANLASHRRWHKPKKEAAATAAAKKENRNTTNQPVVAKKSDESNFGCDECGKKFKRQAYLRKHQLTHAKRGSVAAAAAPAITTTITGSFQTAPYKSNSSSSASSSHSYAGTHEDEGVYVAGAASSHCDYEADYMSDCSSSSSSAGYGRLQIVEHGLTEEESIAAAALTNLRNCASVIQHTTLAH